MFNSYLLNGVNAIILIFTHDYDVMETLFLAELEQLL